MNNSIFALMLLSLGLCGCTTNPAQMGVASEEHLIKAPVSDQAVQGSQGDDTDVGFQDISFAAKRRLQVLTDKMEVEEQTNNYIKSGQADVITRPDGTILYPYGLAQANLTTKKMMYSKVILQEGEKIMSAAAGDTTRWNILPSYIGDATTFTPVVLIKPFMGGLETSLSIITDRRDYDITIQSVDAGDYMTRIGFYYPQEAADAINVGLPPDKIADGQSLKPQIDVEHIKYDYHVRGDRHLSWYPSSVFEDGNKVFIRMSDQVDHAELPVFMVIDRGGQAEVVNYRYYKPYYVIDTIFDQGVLILGTERYRQVIRISRV